MDSYLAVDIGGSKYIVALVSAAGEVLAQTRDRWRALTAECVLEQVLEASRALLKSTGATPAAAGVTIPGLADPERGLWVEASFSGIRDFPICAALSQALSMPVYCENDGQAYALAEMRFGACRDARDFLFMNISNGIGGAIVSGGRLVNGSRGSAGEFGHCVAVEGGRACKCGLHGCLEMHAAGPGIARNYAEMGGAPDERGGPADASLIAERARSGDQIARDTFALEGELLGRVAATAVNLLNPRKLVIGGGVSLAFDLFGPSLTRAIGSRVYRAANPDLEILPTPLGYLAGLYGAASIAALGHERKGNTLL